MLCCSSPPIIGGFGPLMPRPRRKRHRSEPGPDGVKHRRSEIDGPLVRPDHEAAPVKPGRAWEVDEALLEWTRELGRSPPRRRATMSGGERYSRPERRAQQGDPGPDPGRTKAQDSRASNKVKVCHLNAFYVKISLVY